MKRVTLLALIGCLIILLSYIIPFVHFSIRRDPFTDPFFDRYMVYDTISAILRIISWGLISWFFFHLYKKQR